MRIGRPNQVGTNHGHMEVEGPFQNALVALMAGAQVVLGELPGFLDALPKR